MAAEVPSSPRICLLFSSHHPVRREGDVARTREDHVGRCDQALGPGGPSAPSLRNPWCSHFHVYPWLQRGQYVLSRIQLSGEGGVIVRTWIGDTDADIAALKALSLKLKRLFQTVDGGKLGIPETLGTHFSPVLDYANADDLAAGEEVGHGFLCRVVGEVAEVGSVGRLGREFLWVFALLASISCPGCQLLHGGQVQTDVWVSLPAYLSLEPPKPEP